MYLGTYQLFSTPVYNFKYDRHEELKDEVLEFLKNDSLYADSPVNYIKLTDGNLHKEELLRPFYHFFSECLDLVMDDLGYMNTQCITSMWATRQSTGNYHQPHKHANAFLAGVYYFDGECPNGTTYYNIDNLTMIAPKRKPGTFPKISAMEQLPFEEGVLRIFPAWTVHGVNGNMSTKDRYIIGMNSMPVGKSDDDRYDRYVYPDIAEYKL